MDVKKRILSILKIKGQVRAREIVRITGFSRTYINRFFQELRDQGKIVLVDKSNQAHYILADKNLVKKVRSQKLFITRILKNTNLEEDTVLEHIKKETGIFKNLPHHVASILDYAFQELLNNAIEHSQTETIKVTMERDDNDIVFDIRDFGIGIFNNIMQKKHLATRLEAIQDLLKGKQTTAPDSHSGEGIFFTSKVAKIFTIKSETKKLIFDNILEDIFIRSVKNCRGTHVHFVVHKNGKVNLEDVFAKYTDSSYQFSKTRVTVNLYQLGPDLISRSQARRISNGLDKFKSVILDFDKVDTVGQGFADEIFRVWQRKHPHIRIQPVHTNENVEFMIRRTLNHPHVMD